MQTIVICIVGLVVLVGLCGPPLLTIHMNHLLDELEALDDDDRS